MPVLQIVPRTPRLAIVRHWTVTTFRSAIALFWALGITAGAGLLTAGSALASASGSEPGQLTLKPSSGDTNLIPNWSTLDGCPAGFRGSAEMAEFNSQGKLLSRISPAVNIGLTSGFNGTLDGKIGSILRFTGVAHGGTVEFAIGCWSGIGGTGKVEYRQSTFVTYASDGKSYTTSASSSEFASSSGQTAGAPGANAGTGTDQGTAASAAHSGGGMGVPAEAALIAGACALAAGAAGYIWHRRRNRSRLM